MENRFIRIINEANNKSYKGTVLLAITNIYSHLLKFIIILNLQPSSYGSWLGTIHRQQEIINRKLNKTVLNMITYDDIISAKIDGVDNFINENPRFKKKEIEYYIDIIDKEFINIPEDFINNNKMYSFLMNYATTESVERYIKDNFS